ncbi:hypothetical protein FJT64_026989 [Amphibalanus amphitrite]|uniref:Chitin-binding type-2 domain-containing protein n=1 Tax=Amphibalanus amphitrite TaxID=1232801 RepID=A0A6A4WA29_AMPAM|nr:hypothetical protein FJT64_026989 [Amphibalanus amphitrite]
MVGRRWFLSLYQWAALSAVCLSAAGDRLTAPKAQHQPPQGVRQTSLTKLWGPRHQDGNSTAPAAALLALLSAISEARGDPNAIYRLRLATEDQWPISQDVHFPSPLNHPNQRDAAQRDSTSNQSSSEPPRHNPTLHLFPYQVEPEYSPDSPCRRHERLTRTETVWHYCTGGGRPQSFLCTTGTVFSQLHLVCDWWFKVDCPHSDAFEHVNDRLYRPEEYSAYPGQYRADRPDEAPTGTHRLWNDPRRQERTTGGIESSRQPLHHPTSARAATCAGCPHGTAETDHPGTALFRPADGAPGS